MSEFILITKLPDFTLMLLMLNFKTIAIKLNVNERCVISIKFIKVYKPIINSIEFQFKYECLMISNNLSAQIE